MYLLSKSSCDSVPPVFQWTFSRIRLFSMFFTGHRTFSGLIFFSKWTKYFNYDLSFKLNNRVEKLIAKSVNTMTFSGTDGFTILSFFVLFASSFYIPNSFLCLIRSKTWYAIPWNGILFPKLFWPTVRKNVLVIDKKLL